MYVKMITSDHWAIGKETNFLVTSAFVLAHNLRMKLNSLPCGIEKFGEEMGPVKLTTKVFGFNPTHNGQMIIEKIIPFEAYVIKLVATACWHKLLNDGNSIC